jgi:hypothetical protein
MAAIWGQPYHRASECVVEDRPTAQYLGIRGVRLELTGRDGVWTIELPSDDCERIAELIDYRGPGEWSVPREE